MITPEVLKPASPMSVDLHAATFVSQRALRPSRWPYLVGAAVAVLAALVAVQLTGDRAVEQPPPVAPVIATPPVVVVPPPIVVAPPPVVVAPPPMVEPPQAPAITSKRVPRAPPTVDELRRRVAGLETALQKVTAPGRGS